MKPKIDLDKKINPTENQIKNFKWFKNQIFNELRQEKLMKYIKLKKLFPEEILIPCLKELQNEDKIEVESGTGHVRSND